ncbi:MAG: diaminopimelate decarboxylase [Christensenellales bacterium]
MNYRQTMNVNEKGHLQIGGVDCMDLVAKYSTPLYVMDEDYIRAVVRAFRNTIANTYGYGNVAYASKAFSCKAIYKIMKEEGGNIDVVSAGELYTAISAGFDPSKAYFHGNNKLVSELEYALSNNIGVIVVDNIEEVDIIDSICDKLSRKQKVLIRTNPGVEAHTHSFIQTAKVDSKFGFSIANGDALKAIIKIKSSKNVVFGGLHCHIGSQIFDKSAFALAVEVMTDFIAALQQQGIEVDELNLGGGFGVHYSGDDPKFNVAEYCEYVELLTSTLSDCVKKKNIKKPYFMIEPGRSIVGEAGITLYSVGAIKDIKGIRKYLAIDGGMTDNIRPALYDAKYEAVIANKANMAPTQVVTIAGKCCESGDVIVKDIALPDAQRGDVIAVFTTGAYNYSMSSNYNRNMIPPVVFVSGGKSRYAVKPQTFEDLVRNDVEEEYK